MYLKNVKDNFASAPLKLVHLTNFSYYFTVNIKTQSGIGKL